MTQEPPGETGTAGEVLGGGNSNRVVKDGDSVIRQTGPWSPFVHHLLRYLAAHGFTASPVVIEATASTERLSFLAGDVGNDPLAPEVQTDQVLIDAARLLGKDDLANKVEQGDGDTAGEEAKGGDGHS